jgi:Flp pilus assembly protein TadG
MAARLGFLRSREQRGASAVEFALVVTPLLILFFGMVQYGMYFYSAQVGSHVANGAARQLSVGNCQGGGALQSYVDNNLGAASTSSATITTTWKNVDGTSPASPQAQKVTIGGTVKVTISFQTLNMHFPFVPFLSDPKVERTVEARVEDVTDQGCGS